VGADESVGGVSVDQVDRGQARAGPLGEIEAPGDERLPVQGNGVG